MSWSFGHFSPFFHAQPPDNSSHSRDKAGTLFPMFRRRERVLTAPDSASFDWKSAQNDPFGHYISVFLPSGRCPSTVNCCTPPPVHREHVAMLWSIKEGIYTLIWPFSHLFLPFSPLYLRPSCFLTSYSNSCTLIWSIRIIATHSRPSRVPAYPVFHLFMALHHHLSTQGAISTSDSDSWTSI